MRVTIHPGKLHGRVQAPPSKSHAHRALICAALADGETLLTGAGASRDIEATARCLTALGAQIAPDLEELRQLVQQKSPFGDDGSFLQLCRHRHMASSVGAALHLVDEFLDTI